MAPDDHTSHLKRTTTVIDLKARLSEHLRLVKAGHEVVITERNVPVARLVPLDDHERRFTRRLRLTRAGALNRVPGSCPPLTRRPAGKADGASVVAALLAERQSGER